MSVRQVAAAHADDRSRLAIRVRAEFRRLWKLVDPRRISETWSQHIPRLLALLTGAQRAAASTANLYVADTFAELGMASRPSGLVVPEAYAGIASDGRPLASLIAQPAITAKVSLSTGRSIDEAMAAGQALAEMIGHTQVTDAGRAADQAAIVVREAATGYIRMIVGPTCARCIILAGVRYEWNAGFQRHPNCDCVHIPAAEDTPDEILTNPAKIFESMAPAEQDRVFTKAGAQAIRDGADMNQVVNARRGARGLAPAGARITAAEARLLRGGRDRGRLERTDVFGRQQFTTTEGRTVRGVAGKRLSRRGGTEKVGRFRSARAYRLMPESIYELADGDRDEAIRLLKVHGYIL
ncbi:hypothetical protein Ait01nite_089550 [Actinoplanes italicus]|uniref:Phage Mu protein F like protein n=1 Tax=Actinoplanes italicus TaxID=113567 RepID=A0A2T0JII1_9ACTN|nr:hypothetical protein [Actinoplanes italicus]PRX07371.1 hypothetical protein CLV67_14246 [Actinoplanes italicus]GIE35910.1 hypothetical protein Ait01nite_089550 [Actinoplanes italicus]